MKGILFPDNINAEIKIIKKTGIRYFEYLLLSLHTLCICIDVYTCVNVSTLFPYLFTHYLCVSYIYMFEHLVSFCS